MARPFHAAYRHTGGSEGCERETGRYAEDGMLDIEAFREFRQGVMLLRDGDAVAAAEMLRSAFERDPHDPFYISYFGLSLGHAQGQWDLAEQLCHTAVCRNRRQAQLYLNLAEVYLASGRRRAAADTLARALQRLPHDIRLHAEFGRLMLRRHPVLHFLARGNMLNRQLGFLRHHALLYIPRRKWLAPNESRA
jgi:Flp pilus assembly protein TadD